MKILVHAAFTLALATVNLGASAATLPSFPMTITAGVVTYDNDGYATNVASGSWFAMDTNGNSLISGMEKTALSQGYAGLVIGSTTSPGASHAGAPTAGDFNAITAPGPSLATPARTTSPSPSRATPRQASISAAGPSPGMVFPPSTWAMGHGAPGSAMGLPGSHGASSA